MKGKTIDIRPCTILHLDCYASIYAKAFSGEPWNDPWKPEDAAVHVGELLESRQSYGLECLVDGEVAGFLLGTSMLFHYGRTFEINDLAVAPEYQRTGIATSLMERCLEDLKRQGIVAVHLITAAEGVLPGFYGHFGFTEEKQVMLMGKEL
ncbi:MAG: GNAT family N-acetyltransferase [Bacteroidales bacterium]|nr:GNAT family N-acetyltransferase [Bacteroidales bacterium]